MYPYFVNCKFFITAFADGLSQESERQQDFSGLQDLSEYSHRS